MQAFADTMIPGRKAAKTDLGNAIHPLAIARAHEEGLAGLMTEQVDVLICGTGFGGSIAAWRLAELYHAAGTDPKGIVMLERGKRLGHKDFKQSMAIDNLSRVYNLTQG